MVQSHSIACLRLVPLHASCLDPSHVCMPLFNVTVVMTHGLPPCVAVHSTRVIALERCLASWILGEFMPQKVSLLPDPATNLCPCAGLSVCTMVDRPVHVAAGSCYHLMQQRLLEHPSSCTRPGHLAGTSLVFGSVWFAYLVLWTSMGFGLACVD